MTQKTWDTLRDAFALGKSVAEAGRVAGVSRSTSHRAYTQGVGGRPPIRDLVEAGQSAAQAVAGESLREAASRHLQALPVPTEVMSELGSAIEKEFIRASEAATLKSSHTASARLMQSFAVLTGLVERLMPQVVEKLLMEFEEDKLDARDAVALLDRLAGIGSRAMGLFGAQQEALRTHIGDVGKLEEKAERRTKADSVEAVRRAQRAAARAKRRGLAVDLEVIEGGAADP